jgi:hypothetical protein
MQENFRAPAGSTDRACGDLALISGIYRLLAVLAGTFLFIGAAPAFAQVMVPAPIVVKPVMGPIVKPLPRPPQRKTAERHVESTELGYDTGVGPAVGNTVTYRDKQYEVTDVVTMGGGPTFSGNSSFTVAPSGKRLSIGLKPIVDPDKIAELPSAPQLIL